MIEMNVRRCHGQVVTVVECLCQSLGQFPRSMAVDMDQRHDAGLPAGGLNHGFADAGARQVSDRLGFS